MFKEKLQYEVEIGERNAFEAFHDGDKYVTARRIILIPEIWKGGCCFTVRIEDIYYPPIRSSCDKTGPQSRVVFRDMTYYDRDASSEDIAALMQALASQQLRGEFAERIAARLFFAFCDDVYKQFFPKQHAWRKKALSGALDSPDPKTSE
jgi:hypothetical protein